MAHNQPVKQHAQHCQMLFHSGLGVRLLESLDIGCDINRPYPGEIKNAASFSEDRKPARRLVIGPPSISIADGAENSESASAVPHILDTHF